jgi:hypothetical protein
LFAWFCLVMKFTEAVRSTWAAAGGAAAAKQEKKAPVATKAPETKPVVEKESDDVDLFGDDDEEDSVSLLFNRKINKHSFLYNLPIGCHQASSC